MLDLEGVSYFPDRRRASQQRGKIPDAPVPERQRGMRSFLTWSFVLAQIAAVEQVTGSAAAAAAMDPASSARADEGAAPAAALPDHTSRSDISDADAGEHASPPAASVAAHRADPAAVSTATHAETPPVGAAGDGSSAGVGAVIGHHAAGGREVAHEDAEGHPITIPPVLPGPLPTASGGITVDVELGPLGPILGVVDDVGGTVAQTLGTLLETAGDLTAPVLEPLGDIGGTVTETLGTLLETAGDLTASVLEPLGDIGGTVTETLGTLLETAGDLTAPVLEPVGDVGGTVTAGLDSVLASAEGSDLLGAIGGGSLSLALDGAVGSSGTIELAAEATGGADASDTLFQGSTYTDLGITFQTLLPGLSPTAASIEGTAGTPATGGLLETALSTGVTGDGEMAGGSLDTSGGVSAALGLEDPIGGHKTLADLFG